MDSAVTCIARRVVWADRRYAPGETLELSEADADALEVDGAVERAGADESRDPAPPTSSPRPARSEAPASTSPDLPPLTALRGIGPKTAARLRVLGVASVEALAALDDEGIDRAAAGIDVIGDELAQLRIWRDDARALIGAGSDDA